MLIYYLTITGLTFSGILLTGRKRDTLQTILYLLLSFLVLTGLASFRYAIGFDYMSYRNIYQLMSDWSFTGILHSLWNEPLYYLACKCFSSIGLSFQLFLVVINILIHAVAMRFIYRFSRLPWVSVYFYIVFQFLAHNMNLIRQSIAVSFFLLAYPYLRNRRLLPYLIIMMTGGLFHNSLFFVIPLYFLLPLKHTLKSTCIITGLGILTYLFFDPLFFLIAPYLPLNYAAHPSGYFWTGNTFDYVLMPALYCILVLSFRKELRQCEPDGSIYLNSALFTFIINLFITKHFILERFSVYPFILSILAIPEIICLSPVIAESDKLPRILRKKSCVLSIFLVFGAVYFLFAVQKGFHNVYPYVSLFEKAKTK